MLGLLISTLLLAPNPNIIAYNAIKSPFFYVATIGTGINLAYLLVPYII